MRFWWGRCVVSEEVWLLLLGGGSGWRGVWHARLGLGHVYLVVVLCGSDVLP